MDSCQLGAPNKYCFEESNTAWRSITVKHPSVLAPLIGAATPPTYYAHPCRPAGAGAVAQSEALPSYGGFCYLPTPGEWYLQFPLAGSAAGQVCIVAYDVGSPEGANALLKLLAVQKVILATVGGTTLDIRNADAEADFAKTLNGILSNARLAGFDSDADDWFRLSSRLIGNIAGLGVAAWRGPLGNAAAFGRDTGDNTMRPIESRAAVTGQVPGLYRLLADIVNRNYDLLQGTYQVRPGIEELASSGATMPMGLMGRESAYASSRRERRFVATSEGAAITVSNGFTATAPRFTLEAGATNELILRKIRMSCLLAGTTNLQWRLVLDPDARYSSGGTAGTVGARTNMNGGSSAAGGYTFHYGSITATATDADEREIAHGTIVNVTGNERIVEFQDGLIVPASGTLLLYLFDAGAVGTVAVDMEFEEANIQ